MLLTLFWSKVLKNDRLGQRARPGALTPVVVVPGAPDRPSPAWQTGQSGSTSNASITLAFLRRATPLGGHQACRTQADASRAEAEQQMMLHNKWYLLGTSTQATGCWQWWQTWGKWGKWGK